MDKLKCTMEKAGRRMLFSLMLLMWMTTAVAQNERKGRLVPPKDSPLHQEALRKDSVSVPILPLPEGKTASDSLAVVSDSLPVPKNTFQFDNPYKSVGLSVGEGRPSYDSHFLEDDIEQIIKKERTRHSPYRFSPLQAMIPASLFIIGKIGEESDWCKARNTEIRNELQEHINGKFAIDDFSQYAPLAATYGLNLCGISGTHGYGDLTIITGTAYALMGITVNVLKNTTKVMRPDGSSRNSFPSGHTATAFMGAEFLRREYKDVSPWIGVAGYAVAAGTGFFRMYNNRHWLTDVVAGAGIGIMSVQVAYWLYPVISKTFFRKRYLKNTFISPYLSGEGKGLACNITF